ncbi:hypothetical protein BCR34DRAFT_447733, partial [Clohesyomyces aquaticus]
LLLVFLVLATLLPSSYAVFINFDNCLSRGIVDSNPKRLQFVPLAVWATFNTSTLSHRLNITIYGNVTGRNLQAPLPPIGDQAWSNPNVTEGKIFDFSDKLTTLFADYQVLTYSAFTANESQYCLSAVNKACPQAPIFDPYLSADNITEKDRSQFPGFTVGHDFYSSYSFATFAATTRVVSGDNGAPHIACVSANITPDLGHKLVNTLCYLPAAVLALVAIATVFAATCSPWGTLDPFRWTSNYGRDEDLLRLVTPGFGDCLQYIQFIVLAGSLNLNYPGFFQPVVSQASWSLLLFNESLVSHGNGSQSLVDGIYFANGTYGLSRLGQFVGMSEEQDIWAGMAVWLLGLIIAVTFVTQLCFFIRWAYRLLTGTQESDLRSKNWPFTAGHIVRLVFNFFLLPIVALSLFQLVVARRSPASVVAGAVILLIGVLATAIWIFWLIFTTRPRAHLFDDLPTVLTYGPLYNTYSDDAAPFAFIPVLVTVIRGIAIGAIQPSGIAQIIMLAICEVILILALHAFRPFQSNTSMNAYHTFFSSIRLASALLMIAFVPSLGVDEASKGWIGYVVLLLHGIVLVFGFFLNSLQTLIEVAARYAGAGGEQRGGLTKVFGMRQLSKRTHRRNQRSSLNSDAAMLTNDADAKTIQLMGGRSRSLSGSSAILLNQNYAGGHRGSIGFEGFSQGDSHGGTSPGTPGTGATPWSYLGGSGPNSRRPTMGTMDTADPYYRPPRPRKQTIDTLNTAPGGKARQSGGSADLTNTPYADSPEQAENGDAGEGPSSWSPGRGITPAYLRMNREDSDPNLAERRANTDYSVRESDLYYGIRNPPAYGMRGPALSSKPTRTLKTGPADPMGPVSNATGWFKGLSFFGGKKKEKSKGFEVVRSTRMPPQMMPLEEGDESPPIPNEPYKDNPGTPSDTKKSPDQRSPPAAVGMATSRRSEDSDEDRTSDEDSFDHRMQRVSDTAPTLGPIEAGGDIELPSRIGSRASKASRSQAPSRAPTLPRKSSKRPKSTERAVLDTSSRLSTVLASPPGTPGRMSMAMGPASSQHLQPNPNAPPIRMPFGSSEPSPSPEHSAASSLYPDDANSDLHRLGNTDDLVPPQIISAGGRPMSTGYVHQHIARDSIRNEGYDAGNHLEASAEFVDGRSRSISTQQSGGS